MRPLPRPLVLLLPLVLAAGCGVDRAPTPASAEVPLADGDGRVAWRGVLPCADCAGIDTTLELAREGDARAFRLVERFRADGGALDFVDVGEWRYADGLLLLATSNGGAQRWRLLPGGTLQPDGARADGPVLQPADRL